MTITKLKEKKMEEKERILLKKYSTADKFMFQLLAFIIAIVFVVSGAFIVYYGIKKLLEKLEQRNRQ